MGYRFNYFRVFLHAKSKSLIKYLNIHIVGVEEALSSHLDTHLKVISEMSAWLATVTGHPIADKISETSYRDLGFYVICSVSQVECWDSTIK
jgi:hypothetical protein